MRKEEAEHQARGAPHLGAGPGGRPAGQALHVELASVVSGSPRKSVVQGGRKELCQMPVTGQVGQPEH